MAPLKANTIISFILLFVLLTLPEEVVSQHRRQNAIPGNALIGDTIKRDSVNNNSQTNLQSVKKKQPLDAPVVYEANDSIVFTQGGYAHLYGQGKVNYEKIELGAQIISMNMDSSTVYARGVADSLGVMQGTPVFKDGETPYETKTIRYNFKSKRGLISNIVSQQGEGYVTGNNAKKGADDELFMINGRYTTCDHHDHPHFYLQLSRAKVRPKKNVVTGPAYLVVEDVPLPIWVPFFFFPFSSSYSSGFIMPTYMDDSNRGFGLTGGGYYFALNDNMDLKVLGDVYTKGSWALGVETNYNKRYKYSGSLQANYQVTKTGDKGMPDYLVAKDFKVVWSHRQDAKASPNSTFSASVNFATSSYERTNINNLYNSQLLTQGTKTSSVSYSRSFPDKGLTISSTFNIAQTLRDSSVAITLPDLNISLSRIYPFKRKKAVGDERWYEKISLSYTGRLTNSINTKDNMLFKSNLVKDWTNGMNHNIPISATFSLFKYLNVTPTFNYTERWYTRKVMRGWDEEANREVATDTIYGFHRVYNYNASIGISTKLYGMYKPLFAKSKEIQIRHVITPQISISAAPDFGSSKYGYYKSYTHLNSENQLDTVTYSPYAGQPFGVPGQGKQGVVSFDVSNNLEMKYKASNDSIRKVSLIDELGASISYNTAAATRPWSDLSMRLRLKLSKSYTFNLNSSFATYAYQFDKKGNVIVGDRTEWSYGRFGRFQGWGSSFNYSFNNDTWKKWFGPKDEKADEKNKEKKDGEKPNSETDTEGGGNSTEKKVEKTKVDADGYQMFSMPWSFNVNYSFNIREDTSKPINEKSMRYPYTYTQTLNASGNIKISNRWSMSFNSGYDFEYHKITQTSFTISRDLHCWNMSASVSPIGTYRYYNFTIRANASILQDLKWEQRSQTQSNIQWY
ncbi:putative LPS assembly protein LptD [uncultured Bacteroides sp.]|uniref:putative LPS assembly protein LptD n=1 Tax=uncultured Bacteroides sp. TaxID=162156 RepID=UPI002AA87D80|nr:putative LPS assembly protein LptD [uncultured Bacteroides sp.]